MRKKIIVYLLLCLVLTACNKKVFEEDFVGEWVNHLSSDIVVKVVYEQGNFVVSLLYPYGEKRFSNVVFAQGRLTFTGEGIAEPFSLYIENKKLLFDVGGLEPQVLIRKI